MKVFFNRVSIAKVAVGSMLISGAAAITIARAADVDSPEPGATAASAPGELAEVLVTARKREERNIDVPTTVQAFSGATLETKGVSDVSGLYATVPNLYFSSNLLSGGRDFQNLVIRGVGSESAGQPAVATIIDGVYQPALAFDSDFLDVASVEVLKGPQGTIFGRNTEGGALNITLRKPDDIFHAKAAATIDNFSTVRLQGSASGPLADGFFAGFAVDDSSTQGFLTDPTLGGVSANRSHTLSGRIALRYHPEGPLDVNLAIDGSNTRGLDGQPGVPRGLNRHEILNNFLIDARYKNFGSSLSIDYKLDNLKFTSLTGARRLSSESPYDFSGGPVDGITYPNELMDLQVHQYILSQEFRLAGTSFNNRFNWLTGAYLFREQNTLLRRLSLPYLPAFGTSYTSNRQDQKLRDTGFALFADGTYDFNDSLSLDVGVRYGRERADTDFFMNAIIPGFFFADSGVTSSITSNYVTPSASLLYHLTRDQTIYLRYAKGERAGGFPLAPTPTTDIAFEPEKTNNYEFGTKGRLFGGKFGYDLSVFFIKIDNQQVTSVAFINGDPNLPVSTTTNAGRSSSRGAEASFNYDPNDAWSLSANLGYTDAHYDEYVDTVGRSRAGEQLPFVPRFTASANAAYTFNFFWNMPLTLAGEYQHVSSILSGSGVDIDLQFKVAAYDLVNARASLAITPRLRLDVFGKNLADKFIETKVFNAFFFGEPRPFSTVLPPRNVGARLTYSF